MRLAIVLGSTAALTTLLSAQEPPFLRDVTQYRLPNGLRVVLAPDSSVAHVAVETWFRAGTRLDPEGQRGLSHLFEHIFSSAPVAMDSTRRAEGRSRVADSNAQTRRDHTRYYLKVDPGALDYALAIHAGRMGINEQYITPELVRLNAEVVVNEGRNESAGRTAGAPSPFWLLQRGAYAGHPYGLLPESPTSVRSVTADQLQQWRRERHAPAEAALILSGRFDPERARGMVAQWFGALPAGASYLVRPRQLLVDAPLRREDAEADVPRPRLTRRVVVPPLGDAGLEASEVALRVAALSWRAGAGRALAAPPAVAVQVGELASDLTIAADVVDPQAARAALVAAIDQVTHAPDERLVMQARRQAVLSMVQRLERLGFIDSRNEQLGEGALYLDDATFVRRRLERLSLVTGAEAALAARRWLQDRGYELLALPLGGRTTAAAAGGVGGGPTARAEPLTPATPFVVRGPRDSSLAGVRTVVVGRDALPIVRLTFTVTQSGVDADSLARALEWSVNQRGGAAQVTQATTPGRFTLTVTTARAGAELVVGSLASLGLPRRSTYLVAAGAVDRVLLDAVAASMEGWPEGVAGAPPVPTSVQAGKEVVEVPGRVQVRLAAKWRFPVQSLDDEIAARVVRRLLGARANTVLRTQRGWSYGASGTLRPERGAAVVAVESEVQADRAHEALAELERVIADFGAGRDTLPPVSEIQSQLTQEILVTTETLAELDRTTRAGVDAGRPADWELQLLERLRTFTARDVARARGLVAGAGPAITVTGAPGAVR